MKKQKIDVSDTKGNEKTIEIYGFCYYCKGAIESGFISSNGKIYHRDCKQIINGRKELKF